MTRMKKIATVSLAIALGICGVELGSDLGIPGFAGVIGSAEAVVGRPLTPVSYAGVARRTSRRVARRTTHRINALPAGCVYGPYYGGSYYNCGGAYYVKEGTVYIQVVFD